MTVSLATKTADLYIGHLVKEHLYLTLYCVIIIYVVLFMLFTLTFVVFMFHSVSFTANLCFSHYLQVLRKCDLSSYDPRY
jgi:hypothetical protein